MPCFLPSAGITRFDLLGDFGRFNWLGNFYIVVSYNLLFAVVTTLCLVRKFTSAVREELLKALGNVFSLISYRPHPQRASYFLSYFDSNCLPVLCVYLLCVCHLEFFCLNPVLHIYRSVKEIEEKQICGL